MGNTFMTSLRSLLLLIAVINPPTVVHAQNLESTIETMIKDDASSSACRNETTFFINRGLLSLKRCVHRCFGDLQNGRVVDLDFQKSRISPHPEDRERAFVEIPCKSDSSCITSKYGNEYGSQQCTAAYAMPNVRQEKYLTFSVKDMHADKLLSLIKKLGN